jgi:hypothetical protein
MFGIGIGCNSAGRLSATEPVSLPGTIPEMCGVWPPVDVLSVFMNDHH